MGSKLSEKQVTDVAKVLGAVSDQQALREPEQLVEALAQGEQAAFTKADIESVRSAIAEMRKDAQVRDEWRSRAGRGLFLVFEGLDRSGKSTQSKRIAQHIAEDGQVQWMCFPNRSTATGMLIDLYLQRKIDLPDETVHLLFSANRWEMAETIVEQLNKGVTVVCDRYAFSGVAYSAAKGLDLQWCKAPDCGLPTPDAVFFLHVDAKVGASRANFGDERYENAEMQAEVREQFKVADLRRGVKWLDVDGARGIDEIHQEIRTAVEQIAAEVRDTAQPVPQLWVVNPAM